MEEFNQAPQSNPKSGGHHSPSGSASLAEVHRSILVPATASFCRKPPAFSGPGFLIAVGDMDPGNWATDLQGGAQF
jgi:manganese transport protein